MKAVRPVAQITYALDRQEGTVHRHEQSVGFWRLGLIQSQRVLLQSQPTTRVSFAMLASAAIVDDLKRTHPSDLSQFPVEFMNFEASLEGRINREMRRRSLTVMDWRSCVALLERTMPSLPATIGHLLRKVRRFERQLQSAATALPPGAANPTAQWNIQAVVLTAMSRRRYPPSRAQQFALDLMDMKFKLYCITCVDLPLYAAQVRKVGARTPQGRLAALSFDTVVGFKLRAVWETVMNLTYYLETGLDADRWGRNKSARWWDWIRGEPQWRGLAQFRRTVERYENLVRTPEAHKSSRMRSIFASERSARRHRDLAQELANLSIAVWDHVVFVVSTGSGVTYTRRK